MLLFTIDMEHVFDFFQRPLEENGIKKVRRKLINNSVDKH